MTCGRCGNNSSKYFCVVSLGLAFGVAFALCMMAFAYIALWWGYGAEMVQEYGKIYYGYEPTYIGGLWGALWGLVEGFVFGLVIGTVYNLITCMCKCPCCRPERTCSCGCTCCGKGTSTGKMP